MKFLNTANSHSGGGCAKDEGGNLVQIRDQDGEGAAFRALINSRDGEHPVGVIIGGLILELRS